MSEATEPLVYLLYGEDLPGMQAFLDALALRLLGEQGINDFNFIKLDAQSEGEERLYAECMSLPFWGERRLVVYVNPLVRLRSAQTQKRFIQLLETLPTTTCLVLWIEDHWIPTGRDRGWSLMKSAGKWLVDWVTQSGGRGIEKSFPFPSQDQMPAWILQHAHALGGTFTPEAASTLASLIGNDTYQVHQEILKLLTYVDHRRPVSGDDVLLLTAPVGHANIFDMTRAMAQGNVKRALSLLEALLDEQEPVSLLALIVREFRLLLLARELLESGETQVQVIGDRLKVQGFVAQQLKDLARKYSLSQLEAIYQRLFETDLAIKSGSLEPRLALEQLVVNLIGLQKAGSPSVKE
ncbi:DNA polymerase III subunit delta [uncultured Thermanaerothrix sp.]|uniref:DNA polymerase III subunit delta n=1 Tax=uncultured Thermanaerothrix sp. TaxID=1195149 RepID=UPI0026066C76|nr:DNA polymerase III subunit delta [uncultured Thermanaerothrix sp.]